MKKKAVAVVMTAVMALGMVSVVRAVPSLVMEEQYLRAI